MPTQEEGLGLWIHDQKKKISSVDCEIYKKLSTNVYVKKSLDQYLGIVDKWEEKKDILFQFCNENKRIPSLNEMVDNINIYNWLGCQKKKIKSPDDPIYKILIENEYVKKALDEYLGIIDHWERKKNILFEFFNTYKIPPKNKEKFKDETIGLWYQDQKKKISSSDCEVYQKLSINVYVKKSLDEYLIYKEKKQGKVEFSWDEKRDLLFYFCNEFQKIPQNNDEIEGVSIGRWLQTQKEKIDSINNDRYIKLSEHDMVKESLDKYLQKKLHSKSS